MAYVNAEQIEAAKNADLLTLIERCGYQVRQSAAHEYCLVEHDSFKISNNRWCWHSRGGIGGTTIDFMMHYPETNQRKFPEAVLSVLEIMDGRGRALGYTAQARTGERIEIRPEPKPFVLPTRHRDYNRVYRYLTQERGLDGQIVSRLAREGKLYESAKYHNCVFVGYDKEGTARYALQRGTWANPEDPAKRFVKDVAGSNKEYGFMMPATGSRLYVFESPIDAISHATLTKLRGGDEKADTRLSLGGLNTKALLRHLEDYPQIKEVVLSLDNDGRAREALPRIISKIPPGYRVTVQLPQNKDYNDDLLQLRAKSALERKEVAL